MKVNPDLAYERRGAGINSEEFAVYWNGGNDKLREKRWRENYYLRDGYEEKFTVPDSYLSHKELYERGVERTVHRFQKYRDLLASGRYGNGNFYDNMLLMVESEVTSPLSPVTTHLSMFVPTILGQGTPEQQEKWAEKAANCNIIGTYAQTELGHGTFVRGIGTRADYDPQTREFVLNTPSLAAYKFWPGGMGLTGNYAVVIAQLYTQGKCHGVQSFIVQLRDEDTHMPLPGVIVGEIGPKLGMNCVNQGFLAFKNVRIPRGNMLMKNAQVLEDGTFVKSPMSVLTYGTMVYVRVLIVEDASNNLAKAATIATRYSAVRRQSPIDPSEKEPQIIDHVTQQYKIFPQIAKSVIFKMSAKALLEMYQQVLQDLDTGKFDSLADLHALSCCLKALISQETSQGIEICRLSCGGHGYLQCSGFPTLYGYTTAAATYEGEHVILLLQTARFLMKAAKNPDMSATVEYLKRFPDRSFLATWDGSIGGIVEAFEAVAAAKIRTAAQSIDRRLGEGKKSGQASNESSIELVAAADAHCRAFILRAGHEAMQKISGKVSPALASVLRDLLELYAVDAAQKALGDLLRFTTISEANVEQLQKRLEGVLSRLRPNAVALVDGFDFPDEVLRSALGAFDGNVYEHIYEDAMKSPLNQEPVNATFHKYLKPFMKAGKSKL
ncbi:probable peroxisomal acyl-coenzyme A oxidase 1 [Phlebotomus argentipes]|uniref:probable peroxisomal acyl-coenzyme A oxidase 1 n=1 Tax=Phlebotomus argentipes TaxID=94469 RepID=UPI0028936913|nr:probable peroxisomal acyl-coenzyme A oxidase 1 [Phlebotomus argentipes]